MNYPYKNIYKWILHYKYKCGIGQYPDVIFVDGVMYRVYTGRTWIKIDGKYIG